ncbi:MAG TPA: bifunctional phosphoribosylaminoimidazolecarboxamide formyltransferase/IMP cyclohydrolase [bacterium]|nr:bifunctional phosphoribosylaminoimidazolecarboxamide formyltransferase/IMP cyclohydrolase [bacterium]
MSKIRRVLISVSDKTGVVEFAKALHERGVEILSTGGTAAAFRKAEIPVVDVAEYTGSPEILDGRLKTLHPKVHGGLLGKRSDPKHVSEMKANGIGPIDMVVVNLYPFEATIAKPGCTFEEAIENIDIGGPTMIRSAAKNHEDVASVTDPADYGPIIAEMDENGGTLSRATRFRLAKKVFAATARYDCAIASHLSRISDEREELAWPSTFGFTFDKLQDLRYGENPHQRAAFYRDAFPGSEPSLVNAKQLAGKELSYNNIMDGDAVLEMVKEFPDAKFAAVIVKHANPCGAATSEKSLSDAYAKAFACDPISAFGGIIGFNRRVDGDTARAIAETFYEVIAAPGFCDDALAVFAKKKNLRLLEVPGLGEPFSPSGYNFRKVTGGLLISDRDASHEEVRSAKVVTRRSPTEEEWKALDFAWRIAKHLKSNAIVYASADRTLGMGGGQTSRVDSSKIAVMKAQSTLAGSVIASDAFFPFRDGIDAAAEAGATAVIQPGGSVRDDEVISAADGHGMAMVFTGVRHFRH